jgi:AcrR family transcriptional regulator
MNKNSTTTRSRPTQKRAKESVDTILATAGTLLDEVGIEGFNTNLLAERADIRVRTVYRYFTNKYAVIAALTEVLAVKWDKWTAPWYRDLADPRADWKKALRVLRVDWNRNAKRTPGTLSVLRAMNATPELQDLHVQIFETMSRRTAEALRARGVPLRRDRRRAIARTVVSMLNSGTDLYIRLNGKEGRMFLAELDWSVETYLQRYLQDLPPSRSG